MMINTQEIKRLQVAFHCLASGNPCSNDQGQENRYSARRIWEATGGNLTPEATQDLISHLAQCPPCAESWRLAREIRIEMGKVQGGSRPNWLSWGLPQRAAALAVAATIVMAIGLAVLDPFDWSAPPPMRAFVQSALQFTVSEEVPLPRGRCQLRWTWPEAGSGTRYHVEVMTLELEPVDSAQGLTAPEYTIPSDRLSHLPSGTTLVWQVKAVHEDGHRTSGHFVSRLQ